MEKSTCKECAHFHQHYTVGKDRSAPVNCGHCSFPRLKRRKPGTPACSNFLRKAEGDSRPDRAEVIQYLTVDMLQYIMSLQLPPAVEQELEE